MRVGGDGVGGGKGVRVGGDGVWVGMECGGDMTGEGECGET